jgi:hypothetical protein
MRRILLALVVVLACALMPLRSAVQAQAPANARYLVVFKSTLSPADAAARVSKAGGTTIRAFAEIGVASAVGDSNFMNCIGKDAAVLSVGTEHMFGLPRGPAIEIQPDRARPARDPGWRRTPASSRVGRSPA